MIEPDSLQEQGYQADVFSRASLLMTFDLLRKRRPQLALDVRNIIGGEPLPPVHDEGRDATLGDMNGDCFRVRLTSAQIRQIIHGLMEFTVPEAVDLRNPEMNIMARALMQDWLLLAHRSSAFIPIEDAVYDFAEDEDFDVDSDNPDFTA